MLKIGSRLSNAKYSHFVVVNHLHALPLASQPCLQVIRHHRLEHLWNPSSLVPRTHHPLRLPLPIILHPIRHLPRHRPPSQRFLRLRHLRNHLSIPSQPPRRILTFHHTNETSQGHPKAKNAKIKLTTPRPPSRTIKSRLTSFRVL